MDKRRKEDGKESEHHYTFNSSDSRWIRFRNDNQPELQRRRNGRGRATAGDITNVHNAFNAAAAQFTSNFNDPININIIVTAVSTVGVLGQSSTSLGTLSYAAMQLALSNDRTSTADNTSVLSGGSAFTTTDPVAGSHNWWVSRAQAKALSLLTDDLSTDGTFTFGTGFTYDFDPSDGVTPGQFDFQGVAMHEISEIMGRIGGVGTTAFDVTPAYLLHDLFRYTGPGARGLTNGSGIEFSIDAGGTLLKAYRESHTEKGVANHSGPEPCEGCREAALEALDRR